MKKSLITGTLVLVATATIVTGCSHDEINGDLYEAKKQAFEQVFKSEFGDINPNQTWGFSTSDITRGHNANANEWAATYNVPVPLTDEQKDIVRQYFQQNTPIGYTDPHWTNYFVQQVYKGGTNTTDSKSTEQYQSANNGWVVGSDHMDHLDAVFADGTHDHINNFNFGTCSTNSDVLDNGQPINGGTTHSDQIMLMVNSTTNKFGYFNSDGSLGHTDYTGLVSWTTIRDWANGKGLNGNCLNDGWNRSFMGFDFEQVIGDDIYAHNENGTVRYATYADCPSFDYVWDGQNTTKLGTTASQTSIIYNFNSKWGDEESYEWDYANGILTYNGKQWGGLVYNPGGQDWSPYSKLVVEFANPVPCWTQVLVGNESAGIAAGGTKIEFDFSGKDVSNVQQVAIQLGEVGSVKISNVYLVHKLINPNDPILVDGKPIPMLVNETNQYCGINGDIDQNNYRINKPVLLESGNTQDWGCLNDTIIQNKVRAGYLPVVSSTMCKWVKVQGGADGYYSDWIVTLCEAKAPSTPDTTETSTTEEFIKEYNVVKESGRVFCEDLGQVSNRDLDYNDVVFDAWIYVNKVYRRTVTYTTIGSTTTTTYSNETYVRDVPSKTVIKLLAAGGTIPIQVAGVDVHQMMGYIPTTTMINTMTEASVTYGGLSWDANYINDVEPVEFTPSTTYSSIIDIPIVVRSSKMVYELTAYKGQAPQKFLAPIGTPWPAERCELKLAFPYFENWVQYGILPWDNKNATYLYDSGETPTVSTIYSWESNGTVDETGGTATGARVNYSNGGNHTLCIYGGKRTFGDGSVQIDLNEALAEGDIITITGYINNGETKYASLYFGFDNDVNVDDLYEYGDADNIGMSGSISTHTVTVPSEAAGSRVLKITRGARTQTNVFITKLTVTRESY